MGLDGCGVDYLKLGDRRAFSRGQDLKRAVVPNPGLAAGVKKVPAPAFAIAVDEPDRPRRQGERALPNGLDRH